MTGPTTSILDLPPPANGQGRAPLEAMFLREAERGAGRPPIDGKAVDVRNGKAPAEDWSGDGLGYGPIGPGIAESQRWQRANGKPPLDPDSPVGRMLAGAKGGGVDAIREALFVKAENAWENDSAARVEVPGSCGLLHRGIPVSLFGPRGEGKSTGGQTVGMSAAMAGERVLDLDRENGAPLMRDRIRCAVAARSDFEEATLRERFVPLAYPHIDPKWQPEDFAEAIRSEGFTVVLFESVREFMAQLGLNPNHEGDYTVMHTLLGTSLAEVGITPVFMDNIGHENRDRPKGSASKLDATPQAYQVTATSKFSAAQTGEISIRCTRSRFGDIGRSWRMLVGGGVWTLPEADGNLTKLLRALPGDDWVPVQDLAGPLGVNRSNVLRTYIEPAETASAVETKTAKVPHEEGGRTVEREMLMVRRRTDYVVAMDF